MIPTAQIDSQRKIAPQPISSPTGWWLLPVSLSWGLLAHASNRPSRPARGHKCEKTKKGAAILVQCALNSFIISKILQKSRRKNEQKQPKIDLFRPFYNQIEDVFHSSRAQFPACLFPCSPPGSLGWLGLCLLVPLFPWSLPGSPATGLRRWGGLVPASKVCIPYGRGMEKV
jgi:hypothetical protein